MKWVPISPFVDQPQIQNVPIRIQKVRERQLSRRVPIASRAAPGPPGGAAGGGVQSAGAPCGVVPTSAGESRISHSTRGTRARAKAGHQTSFGEVLDGGQEDQLTGGAGR